MTFRSDGHFPSFLLGAESEEIVTAAAQDQLRGESLCSTQMIYPVAGLSPYVL